MKQTLTTEQIQDIYEAAVHVEAVGDDQDAGFELLCKLDDVGGPGATIRKLIDMLRAANREAQPVIVVGDDGGDALAYRRLIQSFAPGTKLYTAPPAPEVNASPDFEAWFVEKYKQPERLMKNGDGDYKFSGVQMARSAWNAGRAAMLAQPVSGGYKLPPHVYRELVNSLRDTAVKFSGSEQLRERLNTALRQFIEPDHPHTRTDAPEGGNGHDTRR